MRGGKSRMTRRQSPRVAQRSDAGIGLQAAGELAVELSRERPAAEGGPESSRHPRLAATDGYFVISYFMIIRRGGALGVCSAGEITNVTQAFQPSGRFWLANSQ